MTLMATLCQVEITTAMGIKNKKSADADFSLLKPNFSGYFR